MNKYGPHIQKPGEGLDLVERWKPRLCVLMDVDGPAIRQFRERSPGTFIVVRRHREGADWKNTDPQAWADEVWGMVGDCPPDAVYYFNEPLGHDASGDFAEFDRRQAEYIRIMRDRGVEALAFGFATGNFTRDGPNVAEHFPESTRIAKYVHLHEYGWPSMFNAEGWPEMESWHTLRFPYWHKWFCEAGRNDLTFFITECGLTQMVLPNRPDEGWRSHADGVDNASYTRDLERYHGELCKYPWVFGATPFNWYGWWPTFEHTEEPEVVEHIVNLSGEEPEPNNNGGDKMRVIDINGNVLEGDEAADLIAYHGITIHEPEDLQDDEWYWAVVEMREAEGPACWIYTVLDENGNPIEGQETAWGWEGMDEEADDIQGNSYPTDWRERADLGSTNADGNVGPGFGQTGWYHDPYEPGPGYAWVRDQDRWSVFLTGIGMLGGTNHRTLYATWQPKQWQAGEPDGDAISEIIAHAEAIINKAKGLSASTPAEMQLIYENGHVAKYSLTPASSSAVARVIAYAKRLFGR